MLSSSCSSQPSKPRRFDPSRRTTTFVVPKSRGPASQREDKNMNTIASSSPRRPTKTPTVPTRSRVGLQPRAPVGQPKFSSQKQASPVTKSVRPKQRNARASAATKTAPAAAAPPLPSVLPLDPNCNEPSLPCLCCDGRSPQDNNSMFNHNHNNNNTISLRQQLQMPLPPPVLHHRQDGKGAKEQPPSPEQAQAQMELPVCPAAALENEKKNANESTSLDNKKYVEVEEEDDKEESSGDIDIDDEEEEADVDDDDDDDDDDEDDDTLVPSCCDCGPSLLEFSLSSSTSSSSSTSISSCSDLESDCADQSASICSFQDQDNLASMLSPKERSALLQPSEGPPPARLPPTLPLSTNPFIQTSHSPCSPDEGYPSALDSPSPDYLGIKDDSEVTKLGLLDFLESVGEFGKMERFSQVIQVARWDLEGEQNWDALRDRLDHLDRLEKVNREVKLAYVARLHEKGFDFGDLEEQDLSDVMDEMGNIEIPWKLYKGQGGTMGDSQEFSDAGVDLTGPSDCDEPFVPDSLTPSPIEPPPRPPKPPARHASVSSDLHTYINISREPTSMVVSTSPTLSTFSPNSSSPTFTTFKCEKPLPPSPPSIPPLPSSKPVPYLTLYTTPSPPPSLPTPTPPIPPPRRRHLARKEAQRLAALQAEQEKTPLSLPPPTTRPPPLPPPPVISVSSSPPAIPPPPPLPPPPSFHALDVEIRKLLMLAGLTQAELLKLSPELGICVGGLESDEDNVILSRSVEEDEFRLQETEGKNKSETGLMARDWKSSRNNQKLDTPEENKKEEESRDTQRTTSFSEIARRRKRNSGLCSEPYYSTGFSSIHEAKTKTVSYESFPYPAELPESPPPPPPPRPLPPIPPSLPPVKVSTLPANSAEPERFDWLIAFTPEGEGPNQPPDMRKWSVKSEKKVGSMSLPPGCAPKVTTFKELRFRNKSASPPTKVISDPDPDPTVITPDPDILYNLKWRREKAGSDGSQWEYTSQAQALFMQPPPALTSMAALKEMLQRADKEGGHLELCPAPKNSCSLSDSGLWTTGRQGASDWEPEDGKEGREEKAEVAVRGEADGGRTFESRTSISSPPLSLAQSSQPYFLHSALPSYRPGHYSPQFFADPRPQSHVGRETTDEPCDRRQASAVSSADIHRDDSSPDLSSGFNSGSMVDVCVDSPFDTEKLFDIHADLTSESSCNFDSLYCSDSETQNGTKTMSDTPPDGTTGVSSGCTTPPGCTTPYKNIDVMKMYSNDISAVDSLNSGRQTRPLPDSSKARRYKALPPLPTYYLYHPKNCPLHRGAPPRLSPIGALSPPHRSGAPPPGTAGSCLSSPLFPRSHTLPALAAPLYYPNLYPPIPPSAPPLPPKLYQVPLRSRVTIIAPSRLLSAVRSASFAGSVPKADTSWMGEDVRHPLRGAGLSSLCLQEKKVLVGAVSDAVEAILGQFSASRTVVQKTLSGDSTINPALGRLVLQCLCPALHSLLTDGLKPHQSDLIAGRRPNSAWGLVQASTRPGPKTQILFNLQVRVSELPQLRHSKQRFNAFLLGLLNTKFLDFWLSHLLSCTDVLETYYHPASFMRLSLTACRPLFEELLLVLQPLSLLTFNLDLLFQHHRFEPDCHSPDIPSPPCQETGFQLRSQSKSRYIESLSAVNFGSSNPQTAREGPSPQADPKNQAVESTNGSAEGENLPDALGHTSPQLLWVQEKEIGALPPPDLEEDSFVQQAGQVIQQGWGAVKRWGDRLSQNLAELSAKKDEVKTALTLQVQAGSDFAPVSSDAQVPWGLGRLFGASKSPSSPQGHTPPSRRPSQWLAPGVSALTRMVSSSSAPIIRRFPGTLEETEPESDNEDGAVEIKDKARPLRSVRTLCDHAGTGSELTFCKGEELVVLGGVDQDWIRCRQGDREGLVPIGYTSLIM